MRQQWGGVGYRSLAVCAKAMRDPQSFFVVPPGVEGGACVDGVPDSKRLAAFCVKNLPMRPRDSSDTTRGSNSMDCALRTLQRKRA